MHSKKTMMVIPGTNQTKNMSTDRRTCGRGCLGCTIENRGEEISDHIVLLPIVQTVWDRWSVGIIRPRVLLGVRHGPNPYREILAKGRIECGRGTRRWRKDVEDRWERTRGSAGPVINI